MLQVVEAGIGNTASAAPTAKILRLPDRAARGMPDVEELAPEGLELVRAAYEAAGGSCAQPVEMRPLARRLGLGPRVIGNLVMRLQAQRLVRVVSMANGLLRLTAEGVRAAESAASEPPDPATPKGAPHAGGGLVDTRVAPTCRVVGRGALRELEGMLGPLKADLDRLDLDGALDEEQRSELAAEIRTIEAQLGSPRPKRRIVAAALESVGGIVGSVAGAAGGAGSETESERILRALDAFLDGAAGAGQTERAARGVGGAAGEAAGEARVREAGGLRVRKRVHEGGGVTWQTLDAGGPAVEGANGVLVEAGKGAGSAVDDVGEGGDQAVRGAGAAGRSGDTADRAGAQEAEAGRRVLRVVDEAGDILRTTLNERGEILDEEVVGNVADLPSEDEHSDYGGRTAGRAKDGSEPPIRPPLGKDGGVPEPRTPPPAGAEETVEGAGPGPRSGPRPQEAGRRTEHRGPGDPPARFLRRTLDGAREFHGDPLGRLGGRLRDDRAQPEGVAGQVPQGDAEARTRVSIDSCPAIEESLDRASRSSGAADRREREDKGGAGRQAVEETVQRAAGGAGQGADQAAGGAGAAVGQVVEGAGEAAKQAVEGAKRMAQDVGGVLGQDAKQGSDDEAREADGVVDRTAGQAVGAVRLATGPAEEAMKGARDAGGQAVDQAAGTEEDIAPNPQIPGEHALGEERQTVRRTVDEPGHIIVQSTLDESGNVLDEKIVGR